MLSSVTKPQVTCSLRPDANGGRPPFSWSSGLDLQSAGIIGAHWRLLTFPVARVMLPPRWPLVTAVIVLCDSVLTCTHSVILEFFKEAFSTSPSTTILSFFLKKKTNSYYFFNSPSIDQTPEYHISLLVRVYFGTPRVGTSHGHAICSPLLRLLP